MNKIIPFFVTSLTLSVSGLCAATEPLAPPAEIEEEKGIWDKAREYYDTAREKVTDFDSEEVKEEIQRLYEKAKESGEKVPADAYEWAREDYGKMFSWEYHVIRLDLADPELMQEELNKLGAERWECVSGIPHGETVTFVFKRRPKSYLRHLPVKELLFLVPKGVPGGDGAE